MDRDIRLTITDLENILREAGQIKNGEAITEVRIEPGELIITGDIYKMPTGIHRLPVVTRA